MAEDEAQISPMSVEPWRRKLLRRGAANKQAKRGEAITSWHRAETCIAMRRRGHAAMGRRVESRKAMGEMDPMEHATGRRASVPGQAAVEERNLATADSLGDVGLWAAMGTKQ